MKLISFAESNTFTLYGWKRLATIKSNDCALMRSHVFERTFKIEEKKVSICFYLERKLSFAHRLVWLRIYRSEFLFYGR